jgi:hypothetical protein
MIVYNSFDVKNKMVFDLFYLHVNWWSRKYAYLRACVASMIVRRSMCIYDAGILGITTRGDVSAVNEVASTHKFRWATQHGIGVPAKSETTMVICNASEIVTDRISEKYHKVDLR